MRDFRYVKQERLLFLLFFLALFFTRLLAAPSLLAGEYHIDDALDSCVKPWQLISGRPIAGGDTNLLVFALYAIHPYLWGFSVEQAQLLTLFLFSLSISFLGLAWYRIFGLSSALFVLLFSLVSLPFLARSVFPTTATSSFWIFPLILLLLTSPLTIPKALLLSLLLTCSLFTYTAGAIFCFSLVTSHLVFFSTEWNSKTRTALILCGGCCLPVVLWIRNGFSSPTSITRWGIDVASVNGYRETIEVLVRELFISATSWYSFSAGNPYIAPELLPIIVLVLAASSFKLLLGNQSERRQAKWAYLLSVAVFLSILAAGLAPRLPGIRRILPAAFLLMNIASILVVFSWPRFGSARKYATLFLFIALISTTLQTRRHFPDDVSPPKREQSQSFRTALSEYLRETIPGNPPLFVSAGSVSQTEVVTCGVALHGPVRRRAQEVFPFPISPMDLVGGELERSDLQRVIRLMEEFGFQQILFASFYRLVPERAVGNDVQVVPIAYQKFTKEKAKPNELYLYKIERIREKIVQEL